MKKKIRYIPKTFHLNHVGYKGYLHIIVLQMKGCFHLNHVGYKVPKRLLSENESISFI